MFDFDMKLLSYSTFEDGIIMKYTVDIKVKGHLTEIFIVIL